MHEAVKDGPKKTFISDRFEFKYILSKKQAHEIESYIQSVGLHADANSKDGPYMVNSLYFDTPTLADYRDKDGSLLKRKKMRARTYAPTWQEKPEHIWLEIKRKRNMYISKTRVKVPRDIWEKILHGRISRSLREFDGSEEDREKLFDFLYYYKRELYRPHVIVKYDRTAYSGSFLNKVRVTFDKNVEVCFAHDPNGEKMMTPVSKDRVIMEVKFNKKMPYWFHHMLAKYDIQRDDFSKYRNSVAALRGNLRIPILR